MKAVIMRGIPGAGKSSYVSTLPGTKTICSADIAHITGGVYRFDPAKKGKAHADCFDLWMKTLTYYRSSFSEVCDYLICDNTNLTAWEIARYWETASWVGLKPEIVRIEVDPLVAAVRNIHQVPAQRVLEMYWTLRQERLPSHFQETVILADSFPIRPRPGLSRVGNRQPVKRTRSQVLEDRKRSGSGCCDRYADRMGCDCLEKADPD